MNKECLLKIKEELRVLKMILTNKEAYKKEIFDKYSAELTSIKDLLGDGFDDFSLLFYLHSRKLLYMLDNDPNVSILKQDIGFRRKFYKILQFIGPKALGCKQQIHNRSEFADGLDLSIYTKKTNKPVIYVANHGFHDDVLATVLAPSEHSYIYWGSLPLFYNSTDGLASSLVGEVIMNRKSKESRKASINKSLRVLENGTNLIIFPEGGWNKTGELLVLDLWKGVYLLSKLGGYDVVPIAHYVCDPEIVSKENTIHTIVDDPIPLYNYSEEEGLRLLRDTLASWDYKLMEKFGVSTREKEIGGYETSDEAWDEKLRKRMQGVARYDSSIEMISDYRNKEKIRPEDVFEPISHIKNISPFNISMVNDAKKITKERKKSDFQRRF